MHSHTRNCRCIKVPPQPKHRGEPRVCGFCLLAEPTHGDGHLFLPRTYGPSGGRHRREATP